MTWDEFKQMVEKALAEAGKGGEIEIEYFDFSGWDKVEVYVDDMLSAH